MSGEYEVEDITDVVFNNGEYDFGAEAEQKLETERTFMESFSAKSQACAANKRSLYASFNKSHLTRLFEKVKSADFETYTEPPEQTKSEAGAMQKLLALKINIEEELSIDPIILFPHELDFQCLRNRKFARLYHPNLSCNVDRIVFAADVEETRPTDLELFTQDQDYKMMDIRYPLEAQESLLKVLTRPTKCVKWMAPWSWSGDAGRVGLVRNRPPYPPSTATKDSIVKLNPTERRIQDNAIIAAANQQREVLANEHGAESSNAIRIPPLSLMPKLTLRQVVLNKSNLKPKPQSTTVALQANNPARTLPTILGKSKTPVNTEQANRAKTRKLISNILNRSCLKTPKMVYKVISTNSKGKKIMQLVKLVNIRPEAAESPMPNHGLANESYSEVGPEVEAFPAASLPISNVPKRNLPLFENIIPKLVTKSSTSPLNVGLRAASSIPARSNVDMDHSQTYSPIVKPPIDRRVEPNQSILTLNPARKITSTITSSATENNSETAMNKSSLTNDLTRKEEEGPKVNFARVPNSKIKKVQTQRYTPIVKLPATLRIETNKSHQTSSTTMPTATEHEAPVVAAALPSHTMDSTPKKDITESVTPPPISELKEIERLSKKRPKIILDEEEKKKKLTEKFKEKDLVKTLVIKSKRKSAQSIKTEESETTNFSGVQPRTKPKTTNELKSSESQTVAAASSSKKKPSKKRKRRTSSASSDSQTDLNYEPAKNNNLDEEGPAPKRMTRQRATFGDFLETTGRLANIDTWTQADKMKNVQVKLTKLTSRELKKFKLISGFT